jgi:UDP-N-acetylmuramate dehydrogenase
LPSPDHAFAPQADIPLAPFSTLRIGGAARWFIRAESLDDVAAADAWCAERHVPLFVLGGGSNLVISDEGFDGLVLHMAMSRHLVSGTDEGVAAWAQAGTVWDDLVAAVVSRGVAGMECLSGIPGTVGGAPVQNIGAYGQEVAGTLEQVTAFDRRDHDLVRLSRRDCRFSYRMSRFKGEDAARFIICEVSFSLPRGRVTTSYPDVERYLRERRISNPSVEDVRAAVLDVRRSKGMVLDAADPDTRSVGSFFTNPVITAADRDRVASIAAEAPPAFQVSDDRVKIPAAWLIERAGFAKGFTDGPAGISTKHPLALINRGGATARDVLRLATRIKRQVNDRFGVCLQPEPIFVGFGDNADVTYLHDTDV